MRLWVLTILSMVLPSTSAKFIKSSWGLENEALIVRCPRQEHSRYPVDWYYSNDKSISTQGRSHIVASGERLKFLPAKVSDTGFYTCIIRSPTSNKTGYVNVTIHKKQPGCHIPDHLVYTTTSGSEKNSKIVCPTIDLYNWTAPVEWFKNCEVLQGSRYQAYRAFLLIDNATSKDTGDYTCKFLHNENGVNYSVSATRSFTVIGGPPRTVVRFDPDSYGDIALPWDPVHVKFRVHLLRMGPPFPPVLWSSCTQAPLAFNARCSRDSFSQCQIPADEQSVSLFPEIIAPSQNETKDVEIGKPANITCSACFGKGPQIMADVLWQVNGKNVENNSEARIQEVQEQNQSFSSELTCLNTILMIKEVKEEDLSLKYNCAALNLHGLSKRTMRLRRKNSTDKQNTYYMLAGFSTLLLLINVFMIILKVFWIEIILLWRDIARPYKTRNDGKIYDAYVIYPRNCRNSQEGDSPVESFVHQILPDVLENKCGYNLCICGRDLLPGEDTVTAVETSIQKSRRHIFVLTPEIIHSKELAYEQEIALHSALIQNDSKAILIEMEALCPPGGLQFGELQESLQHLIKVQGTIKWREDHVANKHSLNSKFWKQVRYHMPVPSRLPRKTPSSKALSAQE